MVLDVLPKGVLLQTQRHVDHTLVRTKSDIVTVVQTVGRASWIALHSCPLAVAPFHVPKSNFLLVALLTLALMMELAAHACLDSQKPASQC